MNMQSSSSDPLDILGFGSLNLDSTCSNGDLSLNNLFPSNGNPCTQPWEFDMFSSPKSISPHSQSDTHNTLSKSCMTKDLSREISLDQTSTIPSNHSLISLLDSHAIMATTANTHTTFQNYYPTPDLSKSNSTRATWAESPMTLQPHSITQTIFNTPNYASVLDYQFDTYMNPGVDSSLNSMIDMSDIYSSTDLMSSVPMSDSLPSHTPMTPFMNAVNPNLYHMNQMNHLTHSTLPLSQNSTTIWSNPNAIQNYPMPHSMQDMNGINQPNVSLSTSHPLVVSNVHINRQRPKRIPKPKRLGDYKCEYPGCGKLFTRPYNLKAHARIHTLERPFICEVCKYSFSRLHDMRRHMKLHSGVKPFTCPYCSKSFARLDAMNRHIKKDQFTCTTCIKMANLSKSKTEKGKRGRVGRAGSKYKENGTNVTASTSTSNTTTDDVDTSIAITTFEQILTPAEVLATQDVKIEAEESILHPLLS